MHSLNTEFAAALAAWQANRRQELATAESWLGMAGLFWLEPGRNVLGSAADCPLRLPAGPACAGEVVWEPERDLLFWQATDGVMKPLVTDRDGAPTTVDLENWSFFVVDRDRRLALRLRDREWAQSRPFAGLDYFPPAPEWRIEARWLALPEPVRIEVPNVAGELRPVEIAWQAVFVHAGSEVCLLPMSVDENEVFFVFRDRSSGRESYGAGRFLKAVRPVGEVITLDFNRAYNPPCAFTPFATCPLPPPENWLPFAVPAGELKYCGAVAH
ncbi:DUF1684 domain-containing protein [Dechloromonas sp. ZY10]|uniref:DUF1684 domain-containing protein n=1 Tax=Dechloromonas aquae TaxID=2664436 RepID=UPI003526F64A